MTEERLGVDVAQFKRALGLWASGVTVISIRANGRIHCMTASSFSSLSIDPFLILICVARTASIHDLLLDSGAFAVNVLRADQRALAEAFARTGREPVAKLDMIETFDGPTGSPIFKPCLAYLDCDIEQVFEGGDHIIVVGKVRAVGSDESGRPLIYFNRSYRAITDLDDQ